MSSVEYSPDFCDPHADVQLQSSDGVIFRLHSTHLNAGAGAFPPPEFEPEEGEIIKLEENQETLRILFSFLRPLRHPDLRTTPFEVLKDVAEAAEKYEVFAAINVCHDRMEAQTADHPLEVFQYSYKHGYRELLANAASELMYRPLSEILDIIPSEIRRQWVRYHERFHNAILFAFIKGEIHGQSKRHHTCKDCRMWLFKGMEIIYEDPSQWSSKAAFDKILETGFYAPPPHSHVEFKVDLSSALGKLPTFDTLIYDRQPSHGA